MAEYNLESFEKNVEGEGAKSSAPAGSEFEAPPLKAVITTADGQEVCEVLMTPRVFSSGGVGWYANLGASDGVKFRGKVPLSGGLRLSVSRLKLKSGDKVKFK